MALIVRVIDVGPDIVTVATDSEKKKVYRRQLDQFISNGTVEIDNLRVVCLGKKFDTETNSFSYLVSDGSGNERYVTYSQLQSTLYNYKVTCHNLSLDTSGNICELESLPDLTPANSGSADEEIISVWGGTDDNSDVESIDAFQDYYSPIISAKQEEVRALQDSIYRASRDLDDASHKYSELVSTISTPEKQVTSLLRDLEIVKGLIAEFQEKPDELLTLLETPQSKLNSFESQLATFQSKLDRLSKRPDKLWKKFDEAQQMLNEFDAHSEQALAKLARIKQEVSTINESIAGIQSRISMSIDDLNTVNSKINPSHERIMDLQRSLNEVSSSIDKYTAYEFKRSKSPKFRFSLAHILGIS